MPDNFQPGTLSDNYVRCRHHWGNNRRVFEYNVDFRSCHGRCDWTFRNATYPRHRSQDNEWPAGRWPLMSSGGRGPGGRGFAPHLTPSSMDGDGDVLRAIVVTQISVTVEFAVVPERKMIDEWGVRGRTVSRVVLAMAGMLCIGTLAGCGSGTTTQPPPPPPLAATLTVSASHTGNFQAGQQGATYSVTVTNAGPGPTNGSTVTVSDSVPTGMTLESMAGSGWTCTSDSCTRSDVLSVGANYPTITTTVNVAANATSPETNQVSVSGGGSVPASGTDPTTIATPATLSVQMTHQGDYSAGQRGEAFTITVSNMGPGPTAGEVTLTVTIPAGEVRTSSSGSGWGGSSPLTTTRNDPLAPGQSYPPFNVFVDVAPNAASPLVNAAQVTGGGSAPAEATDVMVIGDPNACATLPSGNESALNGQYAGVTQGWQGAAPSAIAFSVMLDGAGKVGDLGGGIGGDLDVNDRINGPRHLTILSAGSFYTVGPDPGSAIFLVAGASGFVGCLQLQTSGGPFTFTIAPGAFTSGFESGVATKGALLQINSSSSPKSQVAGELRRQDQNAYSSGDTTALHTNYALGVHGGTPNGRYAMAGSFVLDPSSGTISSITADQNEAGAATSVFGTGSISSVSRSDGRAPVSFTAGGPPSTASNSVFYIVNPDEIFMLGTDPWGPGSPIRSGQAIVSSSSFTAASVAGNHIIHTTGQFPCTTVNYSGPCATGELGLLTLNSNSSAAGQVTGIVFQFDIQNGTQIQTFNSGSPGSFALASSTGRVTLGNMGTSPPILYLASPTTNSEPVTFFIVGTDAAASSGYAEHGANASISNASLGGGYFIYNDDSGDPTVWSQIAVLSNFTGAPDGTWDYTWSGSQLLDADANEYSAGLNITNLDPNNNPAPGLGSAGVGVVAITNGKRILCLLEGGQFSKDVTAGGKAAIIVIAEPQ